MALIPTIEGVVESVADIADDPYYKADMRLTECKEIIDRSYSGLPEGETPKAMRVLWCKEPGAFLKFVGQRVRICAFKAGPKWEGETLTLRGNYVDERNIG